MERDSEFRLTLVLGSAGTAGGAPGCKHLPRHPEEFVYRTNRRWREQNCCFCEFRCAGKGQRSPSEKIPFAIEGATFTPRAGGA